MNPLTRTAMAFVMIAPLTVFLPISPGGTPDKMWDVVATVHADRGPGGGGNSQQLEGSVWGEIKRYTDSYILVDNRTYPYAKNVVIDTYTLEKDERGNVRIVLDETGRVTHIFFYGIDMPDVIRRYKM